MPSSDEDSDSLSDDSDFEESTEEQKEGGVSYNRICGQKGLQIDNIATPFLEEI